MRGEEIIRLCREHVLSVMADLRDCQPGAVGASNKAIEEAAGLGLNLPEQDGWLTWSIINSLIEDEELERVDIPRGKTVRHNYRLAAPKATRSESGRSRMIDRMQIDGRAPAR
jgi:hypothetical protein